MHIYSEHSEHTKATHFMQIIKESTKREKWGYPKTTTEAAVLHRKWEMAQNLLKYRCFAETQTWSSQNQSAATAYVLAAPTKDATCVFPILVPNSILN